MASKNWFQIGKIFPAKMKAISRKDGICDEFLNKDFVLFEDDNDIEKFNLIERKKEPR